MMKISLYLVTAITTCTLLSGNIFADQIQYPICEKGVQRTIGCNPYDNIAQKSDEIERQNLVDDQQLSDTNQNLSVGGGPLRQIIIYGTLQDYLLRENGIRDLIYLSLRKTPQETAEFLKNQNVFCFETADGISVTIVKQELGKASITFSQDNELVSYNVCYDPMICNNGMVLDIVDRNDIKKLISGFNEIQIRDPGKRGIKGQYSTFNMHDNDIEKIGLSVSEKESKGTRALFDENEEPASHCTIGVGTQKTTQSDRQGTFTTIEKRTEKLESYNSRCSGSIQNEQAAIMNEGSENGALRGIPTDASVISEEIPRVDSEELSQHERCVARDWDDAKVGLFRIIKEVAATEEGAVCVAKNRKISGIILPVSPSPEEGRLQAESADTDQETGRDK